MPTTVLMTGLFLIAMAAGSRAAAFPPDVQQALRTQSEIYVATKRADGSRSKAVPVWFWWDGTVVYFTTSPDSHKAKRIRKGSSVFVATSKDGPFFEGTAEVITDLKLVDKLGTEYSNKYWIAWLGLFRPRPERVKSGKTMAVKVVFNVDG
ncbi:MAG TPA: pyridoxamine 5'-phosphate oxidase family protein [Candidatus Kryptonia bacterium]|nr:pyridoxamine 5'-phosphate oxidase family protein [Candidatus Kryptonia bacterium]